MKQENTRSGTAGGCATKARIERAAIILFAERGVDAVTTREIAAASGISEGALYRHFSGKEALAITLFMDIHKKLAADIRAAAENYSTIKTQAGAIVKAYCQSADDDWPLFSYHLLTTHRYLSSPNLPGTDHHDNPVAAVEALVQMAIQRGELPICDVPLKAAMALGVVLQAALHKYYGRMSGPLGAHEALLTKTVLAVLKS
jgi:AcrR family transcriptional regulator